MSARVDAAGGFDHRHRKTRSSMHGKVEGDQIHVAQRVQQKFFHSEVGAGDLVSVRARKHAAGEASPKGCRPILYVDTSSTRTVFVFRGRNATESASRLANDFIIQVIIPVLTLMSRRARLQ